MDSENTDVFDEVEETAQVETDTETDVNEDAETETVEVESTEEASTSKNESNETAGLRKALQAERKKRQDAEAKVEQQVKEVIPDPVTNPDGYNKYILGKSDANSLKNKIELSQDLMRDAHEDYEDSEKIFVGLIADADGNITDQKLVDQFNASPNPAKFAYNHAKEHEKVLERTSDDYEDKVRADERKKLLAELESSGISATDLPNFTNATASGPNAESKDKDSGDRVDAFDN